MKISLGFHGAARTVTGSRYLLTTERGGAIERTVIDAGLFQGYKSLRKLNWREPPFPAHQVDRLLLTHAHIDHVGAIPRLVKNGFRGDVLCTPASKELARLLLLDSAKIQEEDARYANKKGYSKHKPALPLYDRDDARRALKQFKSVEVGAPIDLGNRTVASFQPAGHILGSGTITIEFELDGEARRLVMSGDVGRYGMPLHVDPQPMPPCDVLVCESTYGNRDHDLSISIEDQLRVPINETLARGGTVLIPAFAVGRSQQITWILRGLMNDGRLPDVPVHIDSPMAVDATAIYSRNLEETHLDAEVFEDGRTQLFPNNVELHKKVAESKRLNSMRGPRIIVSASGMLAGGRVLHHLRRLAPDPKNLVILAGYQAAGTRGRDLLDGKPTVRMYGSEVPVRAECISIHGLSAHADRGELLRWIRDGAGDGPLPKHIFLTHGETDSAFTFKRMLERELNAVDHHTLVNVPELDETVDLAALFGGQRENA